MLDVIYEHLSCCYSHLLKCTAANDAQLNDDIEALQAQIDQILDKIDVKRLEKENTQ